MIYARALGAALHDCLARDPRVVLLGEDIADPYGGAFKVTRGLSTAFGERVRTTPISEAAVAGIAAGLALDGMRPIAEVMFGDFITLCADQLVNHIAKYRGMYGVDTSCPVIVRTPMGGGRGYGPTHSQSLEKHLLGVPGLQVVAASPFEHPAAIYDRLLAQDDPAVVIEHKLLYGHEAIEPGASRVGPLRLRYEGGVDGWPVAVLAPVPREQCRVTVVAYGWQAEGARAVVERLAVDDELFCELLCPLRLSPLDLTAVIASVAATGALVTVEEGTRGFGFGSEVAAGVAHALHGRLRRPTVRVSSDDGVVPGARALERAMLVAAADVVAAVRAVAA